VVKNKVAPPFKKVEFEILYGEGISREGELIDMGVEQSLVDKAGAWYSYNGERIGQGKENVRQFLREHPEMAAEIDTALRTKLLPQRAAPAEAGEPAEAEA
jgi:recombination protein RecA